MITGSNAPKVLIVGAGPTGLTLGINLLRGGVPCRVIDKLPGRLPWSRALGLHARSQEIFDAMGVLDAVRRQSRAFEAIHVYGDKGREIVGSDIAEGKRSALVMHSVEQLPEAERKRLLSILDTDRKATTPDMITEALALMEKAGALTFALDEIARRKNAALAVPAVADHESVSGLVAGICDLFLKPIQPLMKG